MKRKRYILLYKSYLIGFLFIFIAALIIFNLFYIQNYSERYKKSVIEKTIRTNLIKAKRGNIYASDSSILAMSVIRYDIHIDFRSISEKLFQENIYSLCNSLESLFKKPKFFSIKNFSMKKKGNRYFLLAKNLDYPHFKILRNLPIFNKGQIKGGFIVEKKICRIHTLENIGKRTLGYDDHRGKVGLEGAFSKYLKGKDGKRLEQRISSKIWKPLKSGNEIDPEDGKDVYSTIDIYLQDIAYHALLQELSISKADHGCVILMDVKSGEIPAMINLEKTKKNTYEDLRNFAVWEGSEPGSTFKTMAILAALEDKKIDLDMIVNIKGGVMKLRGKKIRDSHYNGYAEMNPKQILELSSNVGIAKIIYENYKKNPEQFIGHLCKWKLDRKIGIEIPGESMPFIPKPGKKNWSSITLPWMTFGYNIKLTPLQILTFYNAIANQGKMIKPLFIREIKHHGKSIKKYTKPIIMNPSIAEKSSLIKIQNMLEGVVKNGTAKKYYNPEYPYAGKTGTTQLNYWIKGKPLSYNSSFVGYFPAKNPKYSCIVVISKPEKGYYGIEVAVPVFDKIAKSIYPKIEKKTFCKKKENQENLLKKIKESKNFFVEKWIMPNVISTPGKEIIPILENRGFHIQYQGIGKVVHQSIQPGNKLKRNQIIFLKLEE
ncbi:penicillin-binding protein [Blattabacterium sp. (Blattella germanica) str. Bge]|uniref:penicillin-binding protein n=1 Tax=Blattabacterium sp. (Blattella germanica) TaxID=624186 RepID=UPI0001BB61C6|nr:penicillin-binding protein [Blattabacterium sp. (Blattella germanica)]ACY40400.1 penicillin-binding protein [Blattabacterium sp. (Blattella germanica) str. Bge]